MSDAAAESAITLAGIPGALELPGREPPALQKRPRLVDEDVLDEPALVARLEGAEGRAVAARGEPASVAVSQRRRALAEKPGRVLAHAPAALHLEAVDIARPLGEVAVGLPHLRDRPRQVHRGRPRRDQHFRRLVQVLPVRGGERVPVRSRDADRGRAADDHRPNRIRDLFRRAALHLDFLVGKAALVEEDDAVVLQAHDLLRAKVDRPAREPRSHRAEAKCPRPKKPGTSPAPR